MKNTLHWVWNNWNWDRTWGWDYPIVAMCAARLVRKYSERARFPERRKMESPVGRIESDAVNNYEILFIP